MPFDVSKFLALTALIATTGYACSSTDKDEAKPANGGVPGAAGTLGKSGDAGAPAGVAGSTSGGGQGGAALGGGAAAGGATGGEGGQGLVDGECLGMLSAGGAGGAAAVDPGLEDLCADLYGITCAGSAEDYAPAYLVCEGVRERGLTAVAIEVADCLKALGAVAACDVAKTSACFSDLVGKGCENPDAAVACASIHANCAAVTVASCEQIANLVSGDMYQALTGCMDPAEEGWYEPAFTGTCAERLDYCAGVRLLK